jgi:hypothetical protein
LKKSPSLDVYPQKDGVDNILKFTKLQYSVEIPYFVVADFEALLKKIK